MRRRRSGSLAKAHPGVRAAESSYGAGLGRVGAGARPLLRRAAGTGAIAAVLETHDPGEAQLEGGLLIAKVGKGT